MRALSITLAAALTGLLAVAGCGSHADPPAAGGTPRAAAMPAQCGGPGPVVFAVSGREDSPAPALTGLMTRAAGTAVRDGSAVGIVDVDGSPRLTLAGAFGDPGANQLALHQAQQRYLTTLAAAVQHLRAASPHADVLDALAVAARAVRAACAHGGTIYLEDSGLAETGAVDFRRPGMLSAAPPDIAGFLAREHELPALRGIAVVLAGVGDTAPPQSPLSISQRANLIAIWAAVARAAGARSVTVDPSPRAGAAPAGLPHVDLVPVPAVAAWSPGDASYSFPDSGPVGFQPNTAVFRQPAAAARALRAIARYLTASPSAAILLTGTTARWGSAAWDAELSRQRAAAVKALLVRLGARPAQVSTRGAGWHFPGYRNDQGPDGTLLPGPAEQNRSVIVTRR